MDFPLPPSFTKHLPPGGAWSPWSACGRCGQWPMVAMPNDSYIWGAQGARLVSHPTWNTKDMVPWCFIGLALRWRSIDLYIGLYLVEHVEHFWTYRDMLHFEISFWCVPWAFLIRGTAILIASLQKETTISWAYPPFFGGWTNRKNNQLPIMIISDINIIDWFYSNFTPRSLKQNFNKLRRGSTHAGKTIS